MYTESNDTPQKKKCYHVIQCKLLGNTSSYFLIKVILNATQKLTYKTAFMGKCD